MDMNSSQVLVPGSILSRILTPIFDLCTPSPPSKVVNPQEKSPLMRLPAELRNRIYHFALLDSSDEKDAGERIELRTLRRPAFTTTCRLIQEEALAYYFLYGKFVYTIEVSLSPQLHVTSRLSRATRSFLNTSGINDFTIHNLVFRIKLPEACDAEPSCPTFAAHMKSTGVDQVSSTMDFLSITAKSPPQLILSYKQIELRTINKELGRERNLPRWEAIDSLTHDGLQVNIEAVADCVKLMSNLDVCEGWTMYLIALVLGERGRKAGAPMLKAVVRAGLLCACVARMPGMAKEIEDAKRKAEEESPRMMDRTRRWL